MSKTLPCQFCGAPLALLETRKFTHKDGSPKKFWGCTQWRATGCKGGVGAHPNGEPLGTPADQPTREARKAAHAAFDAFRQAQGWSRGRAYRWMQETLDLTESDAHIARFDATGCERLIAAIEGPHIGNVTAMAPPTRRDAGGRTEWMNR